MAAEDIDADLAEDGARMLRRRLLLIAGFVGVLFGIGLISGHSAFADSEPGGKLLSRSSSAPSGAYSKHGLIPAVLGTAASVGHDIKASAPHPAGKGTATTVLTARRADTSAVARPAARAKAPSSRAAAADTRATPAPAARQTSTVLAARPAAHAVAPRPDRPVTGGLSRLGTGLGQVTQSAGKLIAPVTTAVGKDLAPAARALTPVTGALNPVTAPVSGALAPVTQRLGPLISPVLQPVTGPLEPVTDPVTSSTGISPVTAPAGVTPAPTARAAGRDGQTAQPPPAGPVHAPVAHFASGGAPAGSRAGAEPSPSAATTAAHALAVHSAATAGRSDSGPPGGPLNPSAGSTTPGIGSAPGSSGSGGLFLLAAIGGSRAFGHAALHPGGLLCQVDQRPGAPHFDGRGPRRPG